MPKQVRISPRERRLERALKYAVEALAFYADGTQYLGIAFKCDRPCGGFAYDCDAKNNTQSTRPGKRARTAINRINTILNKYG